MIACVDCETILEMVLQYFNVFVWFRGPQTQKGRQRWGKLCHFAWCKFGGTGHMFEAPGCRFCWPCNFHNNCHNELFPSNFFSVTHEVAGLWFEGGVAVRGRIVN